MEYIALGSLIFSICCLLLLARMFTKQQSAALEAKFMTLISEQQKTLTEALRDGLEHNSSSLRKHLDEGFIKTTNTFVDINKRLAMIDQAQNKITSLSENIVSLQEILTDKRARGAFGEIQLENLVKNLLPQDSFALQYQLSTGTRCDCMLFMPEPNGNIVIDSKFPLENYQIFSNWEKEEIVRKQALASFKQDIKKHISDISAKYIIQGETADGAIMFLPAETIFIEIYNHPDLITFAEEKNIWLASPSTMMAILTTASRVLKEDLTKQHVNVISEHLVALGRDFKRFDERFTKLSHHIAKAHESTQQVQMSAKKLTNRFGKIEQVDLSSSTNIEEDLIEI